MSEASLRLLLSALDGSKQGLDEVAESWALFESRISCATACVYFTADCGSLHLLLLLAAAACCCYLLLLLAFGVRLAVRASRAHGMSHQFCVLVAGHCAGLLMELRLLHLWSCQKGRRGYRPF